MTTKLATILADFTTNLATAITIGGTTATLQSATDDDGVALPAGVYFFTLDGENSNKEHIVCTLSGTSLTAIKSVSRQGVQTSGAVRAHRIGCTVSLTDFAHILYLNDLLKGTTNLDSSAPLSYDGTASITTPNQLATKAYVDATATGTATYDQNIVAGVAGEGLTSGNIVYLKASDGKWYIADSATASKSVGVQLGIAQSTVSAAASVNVLLGGIDRKQTALTAGSVYYLGVAGAISTTKGANIRYVGQTPNGSTTNLVVNFASGDPELMTVDGSRTYVADTGSANAYAITLVPAITAYKTGQVFSFKAVNANTTTSTLNVNGLGVKTIKKNSATNLAANDILAGAIVTVEYDGTNFQMLSQIGNAALTATSDASQLTVGVSVPTLRSVTAGESITAGHAINILPFPSQDILLDTSQIYHSNSASSLSGTFTIANNSNRLLIVAFKWAFSSGSANISAVTYNGVAMTALFTDSYGGDSRNKAAVYYLLAPATGANTLAITASATVAGLSMNAYSYYNVEQIAPEVVSSSGASGGSKTINNTPLTNGALVFGASIGINATPTGTIYANNTQVDADGILFTSDSGVLYPQRLVSLSNTSGGANYSLYSAAFRPLQASVSPRAYKASAAQSTTSNPFIGFAHVSGTVGNTITVDVAGVTANQTGLTIGALYYLADTAGTIGSSAGSVSRKVGIAVSATELLITNIW